MTTIALVGALIVFLITSSPATVRPIDEAPALGGINPPDVLSWPASPRAALITFEETIPQPDNVRSQYCNNASTNKGVEFLKPARIYQPSQSTASPTHALTNQFPGQEFGELNTMEISFTTNQSAVSMKVGLDKVYGFQVTATVYAYSSATPGGGFVGYATTYLGNGPTPITQNLAVSSAAGNIRSVLIEFTGPSTGNYAFEVIDDLTFSTVGPTCGADNTAPSVQITQPGGDGQTTYNPNLELAFTATDTGSGVAKIQVLFLDAGNAVKGSFYVCGAVGAPLCLYDVVPTKASYDFYTWMPAGTKKIRVKAWDFANNSGQAERTLNLILPGPNVNLWAMALEITQGIQSWVPVNNQHSTSISTPPTFNYPAAPTAVPLVADRTTFVRFYAGVEGTAGGISLVKTQARLRCFTDSAYTTPCSGPGSLSPKNQPPGILREITINPTHNLGAKRRDTRLSWNFELPDTWIKAGSVYLEAQVIPPAGMTQCSTCSDGADFFRISQVQFKTVPNFSNKLVHLVRINRQLKGATTTPTQAQVNAPMDFIRKTYPVDETTVSSNPNTTWTYTDDDTKALGTRCGEVLGLLAAAIKNKANKLAVFSVIDSGFPCSGRGGGGYAYANAGAPPKTGAEEVGHAVGLNHAGPPPGHGAECASSSGGCDNDWPWPHGTIDAYGFDILNMTVVVPGTTEADPHDFMSYGGPSSWVSSRNWIRVYNAFTNSSLPYPKTNAVTLAETRSYLLVRGVQESERGWALLPAYEMQLPLGSDDEPGEGEYRIELLDLEGQVLAGRYFSIPPGHVDTGDPDLVLIPPPSFVELMPLPEGVAKIVLRRGSEDLAEVQRSDNVPVLALISPTADGFAGQPDDPWILWEGGDFDGDPLHFMVQYSSRFGAGRQREWETLAIDLTAQELAVNLDELAGASGAMVQVLASDDFNTAVAISPGFRVPGKPPQVQILAPTEGLTVEEGDRIVLRGTAWDLEDGLLSGEALSWTSHIDGPLGTGVRADVPTLSPGVHEITLEARDSAGMVGGAAVVVDVAPRINSQPTANAGSDLFIGSGDTAQLDGSESGDLDGQPLSFHWTVVSQPEGGDANLPEPEAARPEFSASVVGLYELELVVHDGQVSSLPDRVVVRVSGCRACLYLPLVLRSGR